MSITGFLKQINKANQLLSEKIGGAKGTDLDDRFHDMEKKTDVIYRLIDDVQFKTNEFLQPNPASRAKLWTVNNFSKMRGQVKNTPYPQPEGTLGEAMIKYGKELGDDSHFGHALNDVGESLRQMAGIKYALEDNIKQNFLDPLTQLKENDIREVLALRKKTENRRLDYDCKKRKKSSGSAVTDEEVRMAEEKFEESKNLTQMAMNRLLSNELEHITHLIGFAEGFLEYHHQCYEILKDMIKQLNEKKKRAIAASSAQPRINGNHSNSNSANKLNANGQSSFKSDTSSSTAQSRFYDNGDTASSHSGGTAMAENNNFYNTLETKQAPPSYNNNASSRNSNTSREASCRGLYDFDAENEEELEFKEGSIIKLLARLDDNWLLGELNGKRGRFPVSYVEIVVPLP